VKGTDVSLLVVYSLLFATVNALSVALTGDRKLLSGNFRSVGGILAFLLNWRFILAMSLAVVARLLFVAINSATLSIPSLARNATTVAALVTAASYPAIIAVNGYVLDERLTLRQYAATAMIMAGIWLACTRSQPG
jgi:drug/metabolite transporter (DMT)-like permease